MVAAGAILTARGGMTSHAAIVARGMGKTCVVGASEIEVDADAGRFRANGRVIKRGQVITVDGTTGRVLLGAAKLVTAKVGEHYAKLMAWADARRRLRVRANADTPQDAKRARELGAEGIGLCRTEHMFFEGDRITAMREMIVAHDVAGRRQALAKLLPMQRHDFEGDLRRDERLSRSRFACSIRRCTSSCRTRPLSWPRSPSRSRFSAAALQRRVDSLRGGEPDARAPRLPARHHLSRDHRRCRRARFSRPACHDVARGRRVNVEVMIPLVAHVEEFRRQAAIVRRVAQDVFHAEGRAVPYLVGTMIELPRAAITADEIAREAEFFSFGTNDLTQTTLGVSRDDAGRFIPFYVEHGIIPVDPFQVLDQVGVGKLITMAVRLGRNVRTTLKVGICGEHGGEPRSVKFCHRAGLNYVSCSPYRVPTARLAAAQAALAEAGVVNRTRATV